MFWFLIGLWIFLIVFCVGLLSYAAGRLLGDAYQKHQLNKNPWKHLPQASDERQVKERR